MKSSQICVLVLLVVVGSAVAFADGIHDPKVIINGVNGNTPCGHDGIHDCRPVGMNFSFTTPKSGKGTLYFTNESGKNWTSLALIEKGVPAQDISCHTALFLSCTTKTLKNGSVEILLAGVRGGGPLWAAKGIPNGASFSITFQCVSGNCWPGGLQFNGHANVGSAPEPETLALMTTGVGLIFSRRKFWKNQLTS
jgi:hypothetical protein